MSEQGFFQLVYDIVANIPEGKVATYGQIARMAGKPFGARIVGYAMHGVPSGRILPCHRVVNKTGKLAPWHVFDGEQNQRSMLEQEGVGFLKNGCIDMERHLWRP